MKEVSIVQFYDPKLGLPIEKWNAFSLFFSTGLQRTLEVAGTVKEHKTLPTTENSRMHASLLLNKVWEDLYQEKDQNAYREAVDSYFK